MNDIKKVHFIGIGGISMSALAEILLSKNMEVSGSDRTPSHITRHLEAAGAKINYGHSKDNITKDMDLVVFTAAISEDNEELLAAKAANIPTMVRAKFLGMLMKEYKTAIGVSGTHGKTTTTSMISHVLLEGNSDPTILVGGMLDSIGGNLRIGHSETFLTEACEYTNSFLEFFPTFAIILNVAEDHMDFFKDIDDIRKSFLKYAQTVPSDGTVIINSDIPDLNYFTDNLDCEIITFGSDIKNSTYSADNITYDQNACCSYDLIKNGTIIDHITLNVTGLHNVYNSLSAIAIGFLSGFSMDTIKKGLLSYSGTARRFQKKGEFNGVTVIDDYAHHPDEIKATLETAKKYPHRDIWCVFQPHTYTRTHAFLKDFATTLSIADHVVLADIYAAREKNTLGISSDDVLNELKKLGCDAYYLPDFKAIEKFIFEKCINGDLLITMGAGNIVEVGENLISK